MLLGLMVAPIQGERAVKTPNMGAFGANVAGYAIQNVGVHVFVCCDCSWTYLAVDLVAQNGHPGAVGVAPDGPDDA